MVLRVSRILQPVSATASAYFLATVAVADKSCNKFNAVRSPVSKALAEPLTLHNTVFFLTASPSETSQLIVTLVSRCLNTASNQA